MSGDLQILGAAYGLGRVTGQVIGLVNRQVSPQTLSVQASNSVFGDTWPGVKKSLVVVYRYDDGTPHVTVVPEGQTLAINGPSQSAPAPAPADSGPQLTVWGAAYGLQDVTGTVKGLINQSTQTLNLTANNQTFGDGWPGVTKSFVIVASYTNQVPFVDIVSENSAYALKFRPPLQILSAFWGLKDVTSIAQSNVSRRALSIAASNAIFGDGWVGVTKSLDLVYQYGDRQPQLGLAVEGSMLSIDYDASVPAYRPPADPRTLNVIRAAYGKGDVTAKVAALVANGQLNFTADNDTFSDTWPGVHKSFSMLYSWGPAAVSSLCVAEHETVALTEPTYDWTKSFVSMEGIFATSDELKIQTGAGLYWAVQQDGQITASATSSDAAGQFRIAIPSVGSPAIMLQNVADGTYVVVGQDGTLQTKGTVSAAAQIVPSLLSNGTIVLSVAGGTGATFVAVDASGAIRASGSYASDFSTAFNLLLNTTAQGTQNHARAMAIRAPGLPEDVPSALLLQVIWDLTGGFFLAAGFGPLINQGAARAGVYSLLRSNARVAARIDQLILSVRNNPEASLVGAFLALEGVIWDERLMWPVFRFVAKTIGWFGLAWVMAKILEVTLVPEAEAAELTVSLGIWAFNTTRDILAYANSKEGAARMAALEAPQKPATAIAA